MKQYVRVYDDKSAHETEELINSEIEKGASVQGIYSAAGSAGGSYQSLYYRTIVLYTINEIVHKQHEEIY